MKFGIVRSVTEGTAVYVTHREARCCSDSWVYSPTAGRCSWPDWCQQPSSPWLRRKGRWHSVEPVQCKQAKLNWHHNWHHILCFACFVSLVDIDESFWWKIHKMLQAVLETGAEPGEQRRNNSVSLFGFNETQWTGGIYHKVWTTRAKWIFGFQPLTSHWSWKQINIK